MKKCMQVKLYALGEHIANWSKNPHSRMLLLIVLLTLINLPSALAQTKDVAGKILSSTGEELPGVNIMIKGTDQGAISDLQGNFTIKATSEDVLVISYIGFATQEILVADQSMIEVSLMDDVSGMDELVVVGYGVKKKSLVTGAISSIKATELVSTASTQVDQALQGRIAGVTVLPTSGSPGSTSKIRIRGTNSNGDSDPLYIVDGMKTDNIDDIAPGDIESMEVLKDAASSAIYGTEGGNGVIMITTKRGDGEAKINYSFQYGIQSDRSDMELMNATQYKDWMANTEESSVIDNYDADTNWKDEVFENASMQKHHLSFSGGDETSAYYISGSYLNQDGIVGGSNANFERFTTRINASKKVHDWIKVGNTMAFSHVNRSTIGEDDEYRGIINNMLLIDPLTPVTYDAGTVPSEVQSALDKGYTVLANGDSYYGLPQNATGEIGNPVALIDTYKGTITTDKLIGTAYANISPFKGFTFTSRIGMDLRYEVDHRWNPTYYMSTERQNTSATIDDNINKSFDWLFENFASYDYSIKEHNFTILAGYSAQEQTMPTFSLYSGPMAQEGEDYAYHDYVTSREQDVVGGSFSKETMTSIYGRLSYDYDNKYQFEATVRNDKASVFPTNNKGAVFPSFSAGWVLSEEDFIEADFIDFLKLRASWGQNGSKSNLPGNEDREYWDVSGIFYGPSGQQVSGATIAKVVNKDLKWERTEQFDVGFDLRTLDGKLGFTMDYYKKVTKDLIVPGSFPTSEGNDFPFINGGDVTNKGFDFELGYFNYDNKLKFSGSVNLSTLDNEVTSVSTGNALQGDDLRGKVLTYFEEGYPIWYFKGYKTDGLNSDGTVKVVDTDGVDGITESDQTYIGDPHADFLYGATFKLQYEGFDLNLFLQGSQGNDIFMGWFRTDRPYSNKPAYMYENMGGSFPNADNADEQIYRSDLMVGDGSYLRVKQLQLGYTIPKNYLSRIGLSHARLYVSLDDYFTFTDYKGLDPEAGSSEDDRQGVDRGVYPIPGKVLFGLSVQF